ncbi:MAG TPA: TonB-dependent receptor [Flavobacteriales bacterium]|nr:TonB-dependent receptor [Flavobacteriales bacterium]
MQNKVPQHVLFCVLFFTGIILRAQNVHDSTVLEEHTVTAFLSARPLLQTPSSVSRVDSATLRALNDYSLLPALNTTAGVRMEERSPGSYRLSIRGSLLRSPFGIRNIKIYIDEFPLTDGAGNTYLNLIDPAVVTSADIFKGPDGSVYGANSGGVIRLGIFPDDKAPVYATVGLASFNTFREHVRLQLVKPKNTFIFSEGWMRSDGYRENSAFDRKYFQVANQFNYTPRASLRLLFFYARLKYETPGGLTRAQYESDAAMARPATPVLPGASEQHAGIDNSTFYTGILNTVSLTQNLRIVTSVFGSNSFVQNPFITNYEERTENNLGSRNWIEAGNVLKNVSLLLRTGFEVQKNFSHIRNYGNRYGTKDTLQADGRFEVLNAFAFSHLYVNIRQKLYADFSASYNIHSYQYANLIQDNGGKKTSVPQLMPRATVSWMVFKWMAWRAIISKGYSPPTLAEVYASGNILNAGLEPEQGINYESGFRFVSVNKHITADACAFYYQLNNAIVRRQDEGGNEYFLNAGGTRQRGIELSFQCTAVNNPNGFVRYLNLKGAYTYSNFIFSNYILNDQDLSTNSLTGVPENTFAISTTVFFPYGIHLYAQNNYTSTLPLNDANTVYAKEYNLLQLKLGWKYHYGKKHETEFFTGCDNLLNEKYSLGNDLNATGGRYFNAAPLRNFFVGARLWIK